jgi:hypothetical protein
VHDIALQERSEQLFELALCWTQRYIENRAKETHMSTVTEKSAGATAIRPFRIEIPEADLEALRARIVATRWPEKETVPDQSQGVQLATIQALARYWATDYDFRRVEARLNGLPQFITEIDGLDIHFIHVRSPHENALPLIITHGWPGSVVEMLNVVGPLTDPTAYGGNAEDAFHLVIPSMPGYGFSSKPTTTGWDTARIGRAWAVLMKRLGYTKYVAQGAIGAPSSRTRWAHRHLRSCFASTPTCPAPFHPTFQRHSRQTYSGPATRGHPISQPKKAARTSG